MSITVHRVRIILSKQEFHFEESVSWIILCDFESGCSTTKITQIQVYRMYYL